MNFTKQKLVVNSIWTLSETTCNKIIFYKDSGNQLTIESRDVTPPYTFTITAEDNNKTPGLYIYQTFLDGVFVAQGTTKLLPNLETSEDPRSEWMRIYQNLMNAIESLSSKKAESVTLYDGTQVTYANLDDLMRRANLAEQKMNAELGKSSSKIYRSRFLVNE